MNKRKYHALTCAGMVDLRRPAGAKNKPKTDVEPTTSSSLEEV